MCLPQDVVTRSAGARLARAEAVGGGALFHCAHIGTHLGRCNARPAAGALSPAAGGGGPDSRHRSGARSSRRSAGARASRSGRRHACTTPLSMDSKISQFSLHPLCPHATLDTISQFFLLSLCPHPLWTRYRMYHDSPSSTTAPAFTFEVST